LLEEIKFDSLVEQKITLFKKIWDDQLKETELKFEALYKKAELKL